MNEYEAFEVLKKHLCKEIIQTAEQVQKAGGITNQDLEKLDKMFHLKKSMLTAKAMEESEEYMDNQNGNGFSGYRGRSPMTGRYVSRTSGEAYNEGYSKGYSEAMNQMSGRMQFPNYNEPRRW